jgi:hypothetical protein
MPIDLEQIKRNYAEFDDSQIEGIARNEAGELEPEAAEILEQEIEKRGLGRKLKEWMEAQRRELGPGELMDLISKLSRLPCPRCGQGDSPLIGVVLRQIQGFVVFTKHKKGPFVACPACVAQRRRQAMMATSVSWLACPHAVFSAFHALYRSVADNRRRQQVSEAVLAAVVTAHIAEIRTSPDTERVLAAVIRQTSDFWK